MDSLGQRIKALRQQKRMQQHEIAELLGKGGKQVISNWETDRSEPSVSDLRKLADILQVSLSYLLEGTELSVPGVPAGKILMDASEVIALQRELLELRSRKSVENQDK